MSNITKNLLLVMCTSFLLINCNKSKDIPPNNRYYTDLKDTLLTTDLGVGWEEFHYSLDIDKDSIKDLSILVHSSFHTMVGYEYFIQMTPKNGYEILFSNTIDTTWYWNPSLPDSIYSFDTVMIPRINDYNDMVYINDNYTDDSIMLTYFFAPSTRATEARSSGLHRFQWQGIGYKYVAFRKYNNNGNKLAWLKVNVSDINSIKLNSCKYSENENEILIEDK
jgi:hypothetical protein